MGFKRVLGLCLLTALGGCSKANDNGDNSMMNGVNGTGGAPANPMATGTGGMASSPMGGGTGGKVSTGGNTMGGGTGGSTGGNTMGGGTGGKNAMGGGSGMGDTAGMGGDGGMGGSSGMGGGPNIDTSGFMTDCKSSGDNWGKPSQAGPCSSGQTIYGVKMQFGPYGVSSEYNVGKGFETGGTDDTATCNGDSGFISSFGADPIGSADLMNTHDLDFSLYTVFYPGAMPEGEKFPLITWGNGTCAMPEGYGPLLRYVASYGYIVIAANDREVSSGASMIKALDFMFAENDNKDSKFYQKIDTDKVGAMGHSQGGGATISMSSDSRVKAIIIWNAGSGAPKPYLAVSGENDIGDAGDAAFGSPVTADGSVPAAYLYYHQVPEMIAGQPTHGALDFKGHLTLMMEPERVVEPAVAWWDMMLKKKDDAKSMFIGDSCKLCDGTAYPSMWVMPATPPAIAYGHNSMLQ